MIHEARCAIARNHHSHNKQHRTAMCCVYAWCVCVWLNGRFNWLDVYQIIVILKTMYMYRIMYLMYAGSQRGHNGCCGQQRL